MSAKTTPLPRLEPDALAGGIFVGIDPGLDQHGYTTLVRGHYRLDRGVISNTIAGMELFVRRLEEWRGQSGGRLTVAIEDATAYGEALTCYLTQNGFELRVVSPFKVARAKEILGPDANDLVESEAVALCVMMNPDLGCLPAVAVSPQARPGSDHQQLRRLARRHVRWTQERTAACNELHAVLRMAWLADYQRFFSQIDGMAALAFWREYPTPAEAAQADVARIARLIREASHGRIKWEVCQQKACDIHGTARLMVAALGRDHPDRWAGWSLEIRLLVEHLVQLNARLKELEKQMAQRIDKIGSPLRSFKGIGAVTAAIIEGETLSIERFATADRFARFNGTAPREDSSGRRTGHVKNVRCNRRLRQALLQLALNAPRYHPESAEYLNRLQQKGITQGAARIRLARRLSDIIYAMLKNRRDYSREYHLLHKRKPAA